MKDKPCLTEKRIVNVLYCHQKPLTTYQISKSTGYAYATARKYLTELNKRHLLMKKTEGKSIYWWLREE